MRQRATRVHDLLCISPLGTTHCLAPATSRAALEQIVFRREDNKPLSSRRNTICSRPSVMYLRGIENEHSTRETYPRFSSTITS